MCGITASVTGYTYDESYHKELRSIKAVMKKCKKCRQDEEILASYHRPSMFLLHRVN